MIASYPINTDGSNTDLSSSPNYSKSLKSITEGNLSINEEDFPDFCN